MIKLIWAMDENRLIGAKDRLPWHYSADLKHFNRLTKNQTVLMGHETYLSLKGYYKNRKLPYSKIYVCNLLDVEYNDAILVKDVVTFLQETKEDLWVIGGKTIYELALPFANRLYITYILNKHEGDIYLKPFSLNEFKLIDKRVEPQLIFTEYERIK